MNKTSAALITFGLGVLVLMAYLYMTRLGVTTAESRERAIQIAKDNNNNNLAFSASSSSSNDIFIKRSGKSKIAGRKNKGKGKSNQEEDESFAEDDEYKVIAYSVYGDDPRYILGALRNAELTASVYPGWTARFYTRRGMLTEETEEALLERGGEIAYIPEDSPAIPCPSCWRFMVADDPAVARFLIRDADSRLLPREKAAVDEWVHSGANFHVIRDHPNHAQNVTAGLWGATRGFLDGTAGMGSLLQTYFRAHHFYYWADTNFLVDVIWPLVKYDAMQHDSYHCVKFNARPVPLPRENNLILGGVFFGMEDLPRDDDIRQLQPIPPACAPQSD